MSKNLKRMVQSLLEDTKEFLPKEFHPRLTEISKEFFQTRKDSTTLRHENEELRRSLDAHRRRAAEMEAANAQKSRDVQVLQQELERTQEKLSNFESLKDAFGAYSMMTVQMNAEQYEQLNRVRYRLGRVFVEKQLLPPLQVTKSEHVRLHLTEGTLCDEEVEMACMCAIGAYIDQDLGPSHMIVHPPTALVVQVIGNDKDHLMVVVSSVDECKDNFQNLALNKPRRRKPARARR